MSFPIFNFFIPKLNDQKSNELRRNIISRLKPFSQLQKEYRFENIYRSAKEQYFSENAKKAIKSYIF